MLAGNNRSFGHTVGRSNGFATPRVQAKLSASVTLTTGLSTEAPFDANWFDDEAMHASSNRITILEPGTYMISGQASFDAGPASVRIAGYRFKGGIEQPADIQAQADGSNPTVVTLPAIVCYLTPENADDVALQVQQNSGADLTLRATETFLSVVKVAD